MTSIVHCKAAGRGSGGFTLLEVLVSMAIISLGLLGVFGSLSQMLSATAMLRDKTLATWVATDQITEMRVTGAYPDAGNRSDVVEMAGVEWAYTIKIANIPDMSMRRLDVSVGLAADRGNIIATVVGFLAAPQVAVAAGGPQASGDSGNTGNTGVRAFGEGWAPLDPNADYSSGITQ